MLGQVEGAREYDRVEPPRWRTERDSGLIERPLCAPHFAVVAPTEGEDLLLASEASVALLAGGLYRDLLPLLDGSRTHSEVVAELADRHQVLKVKTALVSLAAKGRIVSGEFDMDATSAAYWCSLGATPRWAETRLGGARIAVSGDDGRFAGALEDLGLTVGSADPTLSVVVTSDYLDEANADTNRRHLESGLPWVLVKPAGIFTLFGPVFQPGAGERTAPCWACLAHRIHCNSGATGYLRSIMNGTGFPAATPRRFSDGAIGLAALEIARWIVFGEASPLHRHVAALDATDIQTSAHEVVRRPQCPVCGDESLYRPDRAPVPVALGPSPRAVSNSGGARSVPPRETVARFRHLVSPVSGAVAWLQRISEERDSWLHVYNAGTNLALNVRDLHTMRAGFRSFSSGKGASSEQAEASALCEAVERRSGVFHGDEIRRRARFEDFTNGEAIEPNAVQLFSDRQYDNAEEINARGHRFNFVPARFDPAAEIDWTPVWSLTRERHRYLPTAMLYYAAPPEIGTVYCNPDSNGCASGNTLEEAILQGFFELVERDAFACWWYNRLRLPEVDPDSFGDPYLSGARDYYAACNRDIWMLDLTSDLGIPVFAAVSRRTDKEAEDILFAAGAHLDPKIAALRAVCEVNQCLTAVRDVKADGSGYLFDEPASLLWWRTARLADHPYLAPDPSQPRRGAGSYAAPRTDDLRDDIEFCRSLVEAREMEFLVLDQTRPDIGMPVARTIVPGLRHFWARFAPGRLYDVPVETGRLAEPTAEADLNPVPVFV